jgi:hypothetical protein
MYNKYHRLIEVDIYTINGRRTYFVDSGILVNLSPEFKTYVDSIVDVGLIGNVGVMYGDDLAIQFFVDSTDKFIEFTK